MRWWRRRPTGDADYVQWGPATAYPTRSGAHPQPHWAGHTVPIPVDDRSLTPGQLARTSRPPFPGTGHNAPRGSASLANERGPARPIGNP
jgi:hypothetical protein